MGDACGMGGSGGSGGSGGGSLGESGGGCGERIGVAQEADTLCCCSTQSDGTLQCQQQTTCSPYTTNTPGACDSGPPPTSTGCSVAGAPGVGGGMALALVAIAVAITLRRRFARRAHRCLACSESRRSTEGQ
jgi:MYXO-CTERM domain-containing protein